MAKVKGVIQLLVAAALIGLIVWTNVIPDEGRRIEDAIYVGDAKVLPENEGKRIVIAGTVNTTGYAYDPDLDITFPSTVARRSVDRLKYIDGWEWVGVSDYSTTSDITNASFAGEATIGDFQLDPELILRLPGSQRDWTEDDLDAETLARLDKNWYFVESAGQLYLSQTSTFSNDWDYLYRKELEGSYRIRYRVWWMDEDLDATVIGIQRGNTLYYDDTLNATSTFEGILSHDEAVESNRMYMLIGEIVFAAIPTVLLIVFGVRNLRWG